MFGYIIRLNGEVIASDFGYETAEEAYNEGGFAVNCYADSMDVHWSKFDIEVTE